MADHPLSISSGAHASRTACSACVQCSFFHTSCAVSSLCGIFDASPILVHPPFRSREPLYPHPPPTHSHAQCGKPNSARRTLAGFGSEMLTLSPLWRRLPPIFSSSLRPSPCPRPPSPSWVRRPPSPSLPSAQ